MKPLRLILSIAACLIIAAGAYFWANSLMASLYDFRSPLKDTPPAPGLALGQPNTRRAVLVLIDALRYDTSTKTDVMPFLNQLRAQGASATMHSRTPSYSAPGYSVLMTGAWPDLSDGPAMNPEGKDLPRTWTQDNLFTAAHTAGLKTAVSGYFWFQGLIPQNAVDASFYTEGEDKAADVDVVNAALPWLAGDYQLILIHIDQVDYAGHHEGGARSPNWDAAANRADTLLQEFVSHLDLKLDTVIVFSDHGQIDAGGHGGQDPIVLVEPFVMAGAGVAPGKYGDISMVNVAPTVAALLGTNIPATDQGSVLTNMLTLTPEQKDAIQSALSQQQTRLLQLYSKAINVPMRGATGDLSVASAQSMLEAAKTSRLNGERIPRFVIVALALLVILYFPWKNRSVSLAWISAGAVIYIALFNFRYGILAGRTYSLSSVTGADDIILFTAATALAAFALAWLVVFLWRGLFRQSPGQAARDAFTFTFVTLFLASLPALWSFAWNGLLVGWTLPDLGSMFLGFLAILQTLLIAAAGLLLAGVSAGIAAMAGKQKSN